MSWVRSPFTCHAGVFQVHEESNNVSRKPDKFRLVWLNPEGCGSLGDFVSSCAMPCASADDCECLKMQPWVRSLVEALLALPVFAGLCRRVRDRAQAFESLTSHTREAPPALALTVLAGFFACWLCNSMCLGTFQLLLERSHGVSLHCLSDVGIDVHCGADV